MGGGRGEGAKQREAAVSSPREAPKKQPLHVPGAAPQFQKTVNAVVANGGKVDQKRSRDVSDNQEKEPSAEDHKKPDARQNKGPIVLLAMLFLLLCSYRYRVASRFLKWMSPPPVQPKSMTL